MSSVVNPKHTEKYRKTDLITQSIQFWMDSLRIESSCIAAQNQHVFNLHGLVIVV